MLTTGIFLRYFALPPCRGFRVDCGESVLSNAFAKWLREEYLGGRLNAVFFHVPNEGKMTMQAGLLRKWVGTVSGVSDWVIMSEGKNLGVELKLAGGRQSSQQQAFEAWCKEAGIPYEVCYSLEEAQDAVRFVFYK